MWPVELSLRRNRQLNSSPQVIANPYSPTLPPDGCTTSANVSCFPPLFSLCPLKPRTLACRYVRFDPEALIEEATKAVGTACVGVTKLLDGMYDKTLLLEYDNEARVIARMPCPLAGPSYLTTASEVATLEFAREVLKLPVPRVLTWSNPRKSTENTVGSDYIVMEAAPGTQMANRWYSMKDSEEVTPCVDGMINIVQTLEAVRFSQHGSLYFKEDVSPELQNRPLFVQGTDPSMELLSEKFRIGPLIDRQWWRGERAVMNLDRGPWPDAVSYFLAAARNERKFLLQGGTSQFRKAPFEPVDVHLRLLDMYEAAIPHVLPRDEDLTSPTMRHPNLSLNNIFITEAGPSNILGITDWQHVCILPYFCQLDTSDAILYKGDLIDMLINHPYPADLPENLSEFPPEDQEAYRVEHRLATRQTYYDHLVGKSSRRKTARSQPLFGELKSLPGCVVRAQADNVLRLRGSLIAMRALWERLVPGVPCPISFTAAELAKYEEQLDCLYMANFASWYREHDAVDGWVSHCDYGSAREELANMESRWDEDSTGTRFPYRDGGYSFYLS